jgi:hypothetical protein
MSDFLTFYFSINSYRHKNDVRIMILMHHKNEDGLRWARRERREMILSNDLIRLVRGVETASWNLEETSLSVRVSFVDPRRLFI